MKSLVHVIACGLGLIQIAAPIPRENAGWNSGTRLQAVYLQAEDGSGYPTGGWYDTKLQENCAFTKVDDSGLYCLGPSFHATWKTVQGTISAAAPPPSSECGHAGIYYLDAALTVPLATTPLNSIITCALEQSADAVGSQELYVGSAPISPKPTVIYYSALQSGDAMNNDTSAGVYSTDATGNAGFFISNDFYMVYGAWGSSVYPPSGPPHLPNTQVETWPPLTNYVKAVRQVDLTLDGKHPKRWQQ